MNAELRVDDRRVRAALEAANREINAGIRTGLRTGVERHGLPKAKALSPGGHVQDALSAGSTTRSAYLQLRVLRGDEPLHEFGGVRRDVILPTQSRAVLTPHGPRAAVRRPRRYRAQRFMQRAVDQTRAEVVEEAQQAIVAVFTSHGLEVV